MGKLFLASGNIHFENKTDLIIDSLFNIVERKNKMVFLPTACRDSRDGEQTVKHYALTHGFKECVSLYLTDESISDEYIKDTLLSADLIYADGGNLKFLLDIWRSRNADKYMIEAYHNGAVLGGQSSGAMCWCRRGYDDCGPAGRYMFLDGLDLIPYILCPHFEYWPSFLEDVKMQELDGLGVDDDRALIIENGDYKVATNYEDEKHSCFYLSAKDNFRPVDLQLYHPEIKGL